MTDAPPTDPPLPEVAVPPSSTAAEPLDRVGAALQVVGSIIAPTTLLTAVLFYFGQAHAYWFFHHFGIDVTMLGFTTQDYLIRSVDGLFVPLVVELSIGLVLLWLHVRFSDRLFGGSDPPARLRRTALFVGAAGLVLLGIGLTRVLVQSVRSYSVAFPLCLGAGTLLLLYASRLYRRSQRPPGVREQLNTVVLFEATVAFLLVGLSLFWAATNYAAAVGESRAREVEETFRTALPSAVVYSKDRLHLTGAGVRETERAEAEAESGYRYRYEGLHLLIRSDRQYFFLPDAWSPSGGVAVVVPEGDSVRLQLSNPAEATLLPGADGAAAC